MNDIICKILNKFLLILNKENLNIILVYGDIIIILVISLIVFYNKIFVGYIEVGFRIYDKYFFFLEELNR